jgi:hypothetical protein
VKFRQTVPFALLMLGAATMPMAVAAQSTAAEPAAPTFSLDT